MEGTRLADAAINSDYWYFVVVTGLLNFLFVYVLPRVPLRHCMTNPKPVVEAGKTPDRNLVELIAGFAAWGIDLGLSYMLEQHSCSTGHYYVLHTISFVCFVMAMSGFVTGFMENEPVPTPLQRRRWEQPRSRSLSSVDRNDLQLVFCSHHHRGIDSTLDSQPV